jgi:hypothetical protein
MPWRVSGDEDSEGDPVNWDRTEDGLIVYDEDDPDAWIHVDLDEDVSAERQLFSLCPDCGAVLPRDAVDGDLECKECGSTFVP